MADGDAFLVSALPRSIGERSETTVVTIFGGSLLPTNKRADLLQKHLGTCRQARLRAF